jgi:hypothetical protein
MARNLRVALCRCRNWHIPGIQLALVELIVVAWNDAEPSALMRDVLLLTVGPCSPGQCNLKAGLRHLERDESA